MTAKTTRDESGEVEAGPAEEETAAEETTATKARPAAKRKRRVRVIEVIDDEDLDEVLEALDAEDEEEEPGEEEPEPEEKPAPRPAAKKKPVSTAKKPRPSVKPHEEDEEDEEPAPAPAKPVVFGLGVTQAVVVVVLVALLASLGIWQWRTASSLSSKQDDRDAVHKVAMAYGNVAYNYNATNYQAQTGKVQKLLAGDLLDDFKKNTLPTVASAFQADPQVVLTSRSDQVYVGSVDGRFATAVLMMDVAMKTKSGAVNEPATLLRLSLSKIDGTWKITQQYPSGINDENKNQQQGQLPGVPGGGGASQSPKAENSDKPKN